MRIGIDIDDTLTDTNNLINQLVMEKYMDVEMHDYYTDENFSKYENIVRENIDYVLENVPLKKNAKEVIKYLKESGHEIYLITARNNYYSPNIKKITLEYLEKHDIIYDKFFFGYSYKKDICIKNNIDIMLDDGEDVIESLMDTKIRGILFDEYKKSINCEKVNNWLEFKRLINEGGQNGKE